MFEQAFKNIDDVLRKEAGRTTELDYTEQTSWLLFLKYLDGLEQDRADEAARHDQQRTDWLAARGYHLIRFRNQELDENSHRTAGKARPRTYDGIDSSSLMTP